MYHLLKVNNLDKDQLARFMELTQTKAKLEKQIKNRTDKLTEVDTELNGFEISVKEEDTPSKK